MTGAVSVAAKPREPVSIKAKGRVRQLKKQLEADYATFDAVYRRWSADDGPLLDFVKKRGKGRQRAFDRLASQMLGIGARLEGARFEGKEPVALWAILKPRGAVLVKPEHPRNQQACITLNYFAVGALSSARSGRAGVAEGLWSLQFQIHSLGRYFDRRRVDDHDKRSSRRE
jgi:hypothetical protein